MVSQGIGSMAQYAAITDLQSPFGEKLDGSWVDLVFVCEDTGRKRLFGILIQHRDGGLNDNGPGVDSLVDKMHRTTGDLGAASKRLALGVQTGEGREQRGVNIHNSMTIFPDEAGPKQTHEPGQADQLDLPLAQQVDNCRVELFACRVQARIYEDRLNPVSLSQVKRTGGRHVTDHDGDGCVDRAGLAGVDDRLKITSSSGNQHAKAELYPSIHCRPATPFYFSLVTSHSTSQDNKKARKEQAD